MTEINYFIIIAATFISILSPGPATLAVAGTSMSYGRVHGAALAIGITTGGTIWSSFAAFGLGSIMNANVWIFDLLRYLGASYLLFLAYKSARSAINTGNSGEESKINNNINNVAGKSLKLSYFKGVAIQLSNPKAILFFASIYAVALPANVTPKELISVIITISLTGITSFQLLAYLFSTSKVRNTYIHLRRYFEAFFALFFGVAGFKVFTSKLDVTG